MSDRRNHLLETASRLFNAEGFHGVGIDRVLAEAGVAKTTLYRHFPSKDDLIVACLDLVGEATRSLQQRAWQRSDEDPRAAILELFAALGALAASDEFAGCAFQLAVGEYPDPAHPVHVCAAEAKRRFHAGLRDLAARMGARHPDELAQELFILAEGVLAAGAYGQAGALPAATTRLVEGVLDRA